MYQIFRLAVSIMGGNRERGAHMTLMQKRLVVVLAIAVPGFLLGRLAVRALLNMLLGGTLFGGNLL